MGNTGFSLNQVLHWNGTSWRPVPAPDPGGAATGDFNLLLGVACPAPRSCWAVGTFGSSGDPFNQNEALRWNGTRWSRFPVPNPDGTGTGEENTLSAVYCTSSGNCWAVGHYGSTSGSTGFTLNQVLHWTGSRWTLVDAPNPGGIAHGDANRLDSIRCTSSADCWAVGDSLKLHEAVRNQALHWNGTNWAVG
jgi:hypothetical protein